MSDLVLNNITSGYNLSLINENFTSIQDRINDYCLQNKEGKNVLNQDVDMNGYALLNLGTDWSNNGSMVTVGDAKSHFYQIGLVPSATLDTDAVNLGQVGQLIEAATVGTDPANVALYSDLAQSAGSSLIGYSGGGTVQDKLGSLDTAVTNNTNAISTNTTNIGTNTSGLASLSTSVSNIKAGLVFSKDYADLQSALNAAVGKTLVVEPKTHNITTPLKVKSNTTLWMYGATFVRAAAIDNLLRNDADGITGGYGANNNITLLGGTFDGATTTYPGTSATLIAFGHCTNITIRDVTGKNTTGYHYIEVNACKNVTIDNGVFSGGAEQASSTMEAIQIDAMIGSGQFPWFGPYDGTICQNIVVNNCSFDSVGSGVGTHSDPNSQHLNIKISNCNIKDVYWAAIRGQAWSGVQIINNSISGGYHGVLATPAAAFSISDWAVIGNTITSVGTSGYSGASAGRPISMGQNGSYTVSQIRILGNVVKNCTGNAQYAIYLNGSTKFTVTGNIVDNHNDHGIYAFGATFGSLTANEVAISTGGNGMQISNGNEVVVEANRSPIIGLYNTTKIVYTHNVVGTSQTITSSTGITTPNLVNGVST